MNHRLSAVAVTLLALAVGCQDAGRSQPDGATIRLATGALSAAGLDCKALGDRDTTTGVDLASSTALDVDFDHDVEVRAVKLFVKGTVELSGLGLTTVTLSADGAWIRQPLPAGLQGKRFSLTVSPASSGARLGEVELWGGGRIRIPKELASAAAASANPDARFENAVVLWGAATSGTLMPAGVPGERCMRARFGSFAPRAVRRAYLTYEANVQRSVVLSRSLNGAAPVGGFWLASTSERRTLTDELDPERLTGNDEVQVCAPGDAESSVTVSGLRLLLLLDDGSEHWDRDTRRQVGAAADGEDGTSLVLAAGRHDLGLDRLTAVEVDDARVSEATLPAGQVGALEPSGWTELGSVTWGSPIALGFAGRTVQGVHLTFGGEPGTPGAKVAEVRLTGSGVGPRVGIPRIVLTYPPTQVVEGREVGERFGARAFVSGWAESPSGPGTVEVGGARVGDAGAFAVEVARPITASASWAAVVRARFPDGTEITRTIEFDDDRESEIKTAVAAGSLTGNERFGKENQTKWGEIDAESGGKVQLGTDVELEAPAGAVGARTPIGITRKGSEAMPPLDAGMVNVTAPAHFAYRFLPKGQKFAKPVKVKIPYDPALLPEGTAPEEIQTWYYDDAAGRWQSLPRVEVSREKQRITSETTHFTFMVNAVLVLPDHPGPASFNPNSIKDLKAADPSSGIDLIEPPEANNQGTAQVTFPIRLPKARGAYQPSLRLSYDSGGGNGWAGVGWSLPVSSVAVDTKFGVPAYDGLERYVLDGAQLVPAEDGTGICVDGGDGRFFRARVEKEYKRIVRCGSGATNFRWEVTDRAGVLFVYGATSATRLKRPAASPASLVIAEWYLDRVIDLNGNLTVFAYDFDSKAVATVGADAKPDPVAHGEPFTQAYLRSITYSGRAPRTGTGALNAVEETGAYRVELRSESSGRVHLLRPDVVSSARNGFKVLTRRRLGSIAATIVEGGVTRGIREFRLQYEKGNYGKSRLKKVDVYGAWASGTSAQLFYSHEMGYYDAPDSNGAAPFEAPQPLTFSDGGDEDALSRTESWGYGVHGRVAIGPAKPASVSIGIRGGFSQSKSTNVSSLLDVNGDWLPDRIRITNSGTQARYNDGAQFSPLLPESDPYGGRRVATLPISTLGHSSSTNWNLALQAQAGPFSASYGQSWFSSDTPDFMIDADGDGLVDILDRGTVLFNQPRNGNPLPDCTKPDSATTFCFEPNKWIRKIAAATPAPDLTTDFSGDPEIAATVAEIEADLRPADVLVQWLAPYGGTVEISGSLSFSRAVAAGIDPAWDGVRLTVYQVDPTFADDGTTTYTTEPVAEPVTLKLSDLSVPTPIYIPGLTVMRGSRIFFVLSTLDGFPVAKPGPIPLEEVSFAPAINYLTLAAGYPLLDGGYEPRDPTNAPLYRFDSLDDFKLAGAPLSAVTVPVNGTLAFDSKIVKKPCADDVRVCIQKFSDSTEVADLGCDTTATGVAILWSKDLLSATSGTISVAPTASVVAGEKLVFRIESDLSFDPGAVDWDIAGSMISICGAAGEPCPPPPAEDVDQYSFVTDAYLPLHLPVDPGMDREKLASAQPSPLPVRAWIATEPGTLHVTNTTDGEGGELGGVIFAIRKLDGLVWQDGAPQKGALDALAEVVKIDVEPGDQVFFEAHSAKPFAFEWDTTKYVDCSTDGGSAWCPVNVHHYAWKPQASFKGASGTVQVEVPVNVTIDGLRREDATEGTEELLGIVSPFGGGFHGWRYGVWGGPNDQPIDPALFEASASDEEFDTGGSDEETAEAGLDRLDPDGATGDSVDKKRAERVQPLIPRRNGSYFGKSRPGLKPRVPAYVSRDGNVYVTQGTMHAARDGGYVEGGEEAGSGSSVAARFKMGKMSRLSVGTSTQGGLSLLFAGVNVGAGSSRSKADVRDMNGDGIVDVVSSSDEGKITVKLTDPRLLSQLATFGLESGGDIQNSKDVSVSYNLGISDAVKTFVPETSIVGGMVAMYPSVSGGLGVNFSATTGELADVNGDGLPDAVRRVAGEKGFRVRLNLGNAFGAEDFVPSGQWADGALDTLIGKLGSGIGSAGGKRRLGLLSVLRGGTYKTVSDPNMVRRTTAVSINDNLGKGIGERFAATVNWESSIAATSVALMDVNGDGLPDYVRKGAKDTQMKVMLNTGYGFEAERGWNMTAWPAHVAKPWLRSRAWVPTMKTLLDWTVGPNPTVDSIEANGTYSAKPTVGFAFTFSFPILFVRLHFTVGADYTPKKVAGLDLGLQDVNGDGLPDHVLKAQKLAGKDNHAVYVRISKLQKGNLLKSVSRPLGGGVELDYTRSSPSVDMAGSRWVMTKVVRRDGRGSAIGAPPVDGHDVETTYSYEGGYHDRAERDFLGFSRVERVQADGTRVVQHYVAKASVNFAKKGLLVKEETWSSGGKLFVSTENQYSTPKYLLGVPNTDCVNRTPFFLDAVDYCQSFEVDLTETKRTHYEGSVVAGQTSIPAGTYVSSTQEFLEYDAHGNVTKFHDHGDDADAGDDVWATVTYASGDAAWGKHSVSRPKTVEVRTAADGGGLLLRKREATYDALGNVDTFTAQYAADGKTVVTDLDWTADGTLSVFKAPPVDGRQYTISYTYDAVTRTYPVTITDAHGYSSTAGYDLRFGEVATTKDVNGKVTTRELDANGRLAKLFGPRSTTVPLVTVDYQLKGTTAQPVAWARTANRLPDGNSIDTVILMDGLKRVIQTKKTAEVSSGAEDGSVALGWSVSGMQVFDEMGRVSQQGLTFFQADASGSLAAYVPGTLIQPTTTTYDPLGRPSTVTSPAEPDFEKSTGRTATTTTVYSVATPPGSAIPRLSTAVTDANKHVRVAYRALADRITAVEEQTSAPDPTANQVTSYLYNPVGELTGITDAAGNATSIAYDLLGRRTQIVNPDAGQTDFVYDAMGNMVLKQDSNLRDRTGPPVYIRYEYDLDQLTGIRYPEGSVTMDVKFEYGPPGVREANDAGRINRVVDDAGEETRAYGPLGELVRSTRTLRPLKPLEAPMVFTTKFGFDEYGRMNWITYPDGETVQYQYDRGGLLRYARGDRPATVHYPAASEVYLQFMRYDEFGQRKVVKLGNGALTKYGYYEQTHRLASLVTTAVGRELQDLGYGYDLVGNVTDEVNKLDPSTDNRSGKVTYKFGYDSLDRLKWAKGVADARPGVTDQFETNYGYSNIHNMSSNKQVHKVTTVTDLGTEVAFPPHTNHDFTYTYGGVGPHQATQIGDTRFTYDKNGNTTSECRDHEDPTCSVNRDHYRKLEWTEDNRLASVIDGGGKSITKFIYDAAGERVVKYGRGGASITIGQFFNVKGRTAATKHVFAGTMRLASKLLPPGAWASPTLGAPIPPTTGTGTTTTTGGSPVGDGVPNENGCDPSDYQPNKCPILANGEPVVPYPFQDTKVRPETYYYHPDHLGSTSWVTDQNGKVHEHVEYFPYGEVWREPKSDRDGAGVKGQRFLFSGKELDEETGLYYFGARYYDPVMTRWDSTDPVWLDLAVPLVSEGNSEKSGDSDLGSASRADGPEARLAFEKRLKVSPRSLNLFAYANLNPLMFVDLDGLSSLEYDGASHSLTLRDSQGQVVGTYTANNNTTSNSNGPWLNGTYTYAYRNPHPESGVNDAYGEQGIQVFTVPERPGMGVHAGRANAGGPNHPTLGCIRTTEAAMQQINATHGTDPLTQITVTNNNPAAPQTGTAQ